MYKLKIITTTVREERQGIKVAQWVKKQAEVYGKYEVELIDLEELDLPLCKEPNHPSMQQYKYETTKNWSRIINDADAFVFVLAEYNFSFPAPLKNALDSIYKEWNYKPVAIVSYAGISGGLRSLSALYNVFASLRMSTIADSVIFPFFGEHINKESGIFDPGDRSEKSAVKMFDELHIWTEALVELRSKKATQSH